MKPKAKEKKRSVTSKKQVKTNQPRRSNSSSRTSDTSTSSNKRKAAHSLIDEFDSTDQDERSLLPLYRERNDEMIHEEGMDPYGKEEFFILGDESDSDEYESEEDDDFEKDFSTSFIYPELATPSKIISTASINNQPFYLIQFDDSKVYYIKLEIAEAKCEELVANYHKKRLIERNVQFRTF